MIDTTEHPEGIRVGALKLVGTNEDEIYRNFKELVENEEAYHAMALPATPTVTDLPAGGSRMFWKTNRNACCRFDMLPIE